MDSTKPIVGEYADISIAAQPGFGGWGGWGGYGGYGGYGWRAYGNPWDVPGGPPPPWGFVPWGGVAPWATTTVYGVIPQYPQWAGPDPNAVGPYLGPPRTVVTTYDPNYWNNYQPWSSLPAPVLPPVTVAPFDPYVAAPAGGCAIVPITIPSVIQTTASYTQTITQPPPDAVVTVYVDPGSGGTSTDWGPVETVYEVIVYTTTATVPYVSTTSD